MSDRSLGLLDCGPIRDASVVERSDGTAVLLVRGRDNGAQFEFDRQPDAEALRDTARELLRCFDPDAPAPSDGLDTTARYDHE